MATIFDTSVWIRHFRAPEQKLVDALEEGTLLVHEMVIGELAVGRIPKPKTTLSDLLRQSFAPVVPLQELLRFLQQRKLVSKELGWVDIHLIASALAVDADLVTYDLPLAAAWKKIS